MYATFEIRIKENFVNLDNTWFLFEMVMTVLWLYVIIENAKTNEPDKKKIVRSRILNEFA